MTECECDRAQRHSFLSAPASKSSGHGEEIQRHNELFHSFASGHKQAPRSTECLMVDRARISPLIVAGPSLRHMNTNLSKSRVRTLFNCRGHVVSPSRRFGVQAKRRGANVEGKALPGDQCLHRLNRGRITRQFPFIRRRRRDRSRVTMRLGRTDGKKQKR